MNESSAIVNRVQRYCADAGFDLVQPLQVGWYNSRVRGSLCLEDFGSSSNLALVIGNTRALWPRLRDALRRDPALLGAADPLDAYTERTVAAAVATLGVTASVRYAHDPGERQIAIQRMAHAAGLAYLTESHLSVHATFGPWIGLRAAVSLGVASPDLDAPDLPHPCGSCRSRCLPAFELALGAAQGELTRTVAVAHWQSWLACRDACPTGREHRYADEQIRYHYLQDREQLRRECVKGKDEQFQ